ncbi:Hypp8166 [Branchiostoma lanceolatum]|nr:Hypp8166 [Branchiostoma lanceolatum]
MKKHPFFREAQRRNAVEVLVVPFKQLQAVVDAISDKIAHVQEVFVYMTARCGSTLLTRVVEATSVAQACSEPEVLDTLCLEIIRSRHQSENPSSDQTPAVLLNDATSVALLKNIVTLLNYYLVTSDSRHRSVIFYKLQSRPVLVAESMLRSFPTAKTVFLYRNGTEFYESWTRVWFKNPAVYKALTSIARLGFWRWVPTPPHDFKIWGDDPTFTTVRYHGSYYHCTVARWLGAMQRTVELEQKYPGYFFTAKVYYTALARDKQATLASLMMKLGIEWNPVGQEEERKRVKRTFAEDSQSGTFLSHRTGAPGEKWAPCTSPTWIGEWEREYISHVCGEAGNGIPGPDFILPDSIV